MTKSIVFKHFRIKDIQYLKEIDKRNSKEKEVRIKFNMKINIILPIKTLDSLFFYKYGYFFAFSLKCVFNPLKNWGWVVASYPIPQIKSLDYDDSIRFHSLSESWVGSPCSKCLGGVCIEHPHNPSMIFSCFHLEGVQSYMCNLYIASRWDDSI